MLCVACVMYDCYMCYVYCVANGLDYQLYCKGGLIILNDIAFHHLFHIFPVKDLYLSHQCMLYCVWEISVSEWCILLTYLYCLCYIETFILSVVTVWVMCSMCDCYMRYSTYFRWKNNINTSQINACYRVYEKYLYLNGAFNQLISVGYY
jgi:hypothetical protein